MLTPGEKVLTDTPSTEVPSRPAIVDNLAAANEVGPVAWTVCDGKVDARTQDDDDGPDIVAAQLGDHPVSGVLGISALVAARSSASTVIVAQTVPTAMWCEVLRAV